LECHDANSSIRAAIFLAAILAALRALRIDQVILHRSE
jgi:hypothetical protein